MSSFNPVTRVMSLLKVFSAAEPDLSASEIQIRAKLPKTTLYRLLRNLTNEGWLERSERTGKYSIGPALYILGNFYISATDLIRAAEPVIQLVNEITQEVVNISIRDQQNIVSILRKESSFSITLSIHVGSVLPAHATAAGKALLSELPENEIDILYPEERLPALTDKTISTKTELKLALEQIKTTGISFIDDEYDYGIYSVASLIRNVNSSPIAAMSIAMPKYRMNQDDYKLLAEIVKVASNLVSYRLGYSEDKYSVRKVEDLRLWWKQRVKGTSRVLSKRNRAMT